MPTNRIQSNWSSRLRLPAIAVLACLLCVPAASQQRDGGNDRDRDRDGDSDRSNRWQLPDDATSKNNRFLERVLERYPEADKNNDGILDKDEFNAYLPKLQEQWRNRGRNNRGRLTPTHDDIPYGDDQNQVIDLYLPESETPVPLVIFFHGGQFITGDEDRPRTIDIRSYLAQGIAVASVDYRDATVEPFPAAFEDAVTAIQYLRFYAENFNLNPEKIGSFGDEAGGNLALYLGLHDDMAVKTKKTTREKLQEKEEAEKAAEEARRAEEDAEAKGEGEDKAEDKKKDVKKTQVPKGDRPWENPGLREMSTRLKGVFALHPIATFDPRAWKKHKIPMNDHERLMTKYLDVRFLEPLTDRDVIDLVEDISPLELISADDPPLLLTSFYQDLDLNENTTWTIMRHHPKQIQLIQQAMRAKGNQVTIRYRGMKNDPNIRSLQFFSGLLK